MLVFDALICNEVRHFVTFGILRDNKSGNAVSPAPIFDNVISLFCYSMKDDLSDLENTQVLDLTLMEYHTKDYVLIS